MMLYVNGDSYSIVSDGKKYSDFLKEKFDCSVLNNSLSGSCNSRILRTSLRDLIELKKTHKKIKAIINVTYVIRTEVWDPTPKDPKDYNNDGNFVNLTPTNVKDWASKDKTVTSKIYHDYCKQFLIHYNVESEITKLLQNIILLSSWCKLNDVDYVIFSGPLQETIDFTAPFIKPFYNLVCEDKNILNLFEFSFTEWCLEHNFTPITKNRTQEIHGKIYDVGHHGEAAHHAFSEFLFENYLK